MQFFVSRIFALPFGVIGAVAMYFGCRNLYRASDSIIWPTAEGVIRQSSVEYHRDKKGAGTYHAKIMYDFVVNGTTFSGDRIAFGDYGSNNPSHARRIVNKYPEGENVAVYHMPNNPEVCVLEPGVKGQVWLIPAFGLIFFVSGSLMVVYLPRLPRKKTTTEQPRAGDV